MTEMQKLINLIEENEFYCVKDDAFLYVPIKEIKDHGFDHAATSGIYLSENNGVWACIFQPMVRKIDANDPKFSAENTGIILNGALNFIKHDYPYFDDDKIIQVEWDVDLENELSDNSKYGTINGTFCVKTDAENIFSLINALDDFPIVELEIINMDSSE